jgi:hypothetical protein
MIRALTGILTLLPASFQEPSRREAAPPPAAVKEAEKTVRDLFKDDYAKKSAADRLALARTLLESAEKTADPPAVRWVLFVEAREVALLAGDADLAFGAVDAQARVFVVKPGTSTGPPTGTGARSAGSRASRR